MEIKETNYVKAKIKKLVGRFSLPQYELASPSHVIRRRKRKENDKEKREPNWPRMVSQTKEHCSNLGNNEMVDSWSSLSFIVAGFFHGGWCPFAFFGGKKEMIIFSEVRSLSP